MTGSRRTRRSRAVCSAGTPWIQTERVRSDRTLVAVAVIASPICDATGAIIGASAIARDVSERNRLEQRLELLATRDPLTGLPTVGPSRRSWSARCSS